MDIHPTERDRRIQHLFDEAIERDPDERGQFLDAACADDPDLAREVASLMEAFEARARQVRSVLGQLAPTIPAPREGNVGDGRLAGRTVAHYQILKQLGHGGMGEVYLALREQPFKQYVALKRIRRGFDSAEMLRRFHLERQILASLNHSGVARLLDGGTTDDGLAYLVMEYVEGQPITHYCDAHRLSLRERLQLFQEVCRVVHYAHQNLIVHRDLKPSNILVTETRQVKLLDFGVAKLLNPSLSGVDVPVTRTLDRMMTPDYAAPEQVRGGSITTTTDVYALGVLLYELLTGQRPYRLQNSSPSEIERIICDQEVERPSLRVRRHATPSPADAQEAAVAPHDRSARQLQRELRGDLDNIVLRAMRKEPALRYASAEQLAADVGRHLAGLPVEARPSTVRYRVRKFVRRHRIAVATAAVAALALVGALSVTMWQMQATRAERDRAEAALAQSETVTAFLAGLFEASDPRGNRGDTLTSYQLLERGVAQIEALQNEPLVQARMLDVVGRVYYGLAAYDQADRLLSRSLAIRQAEHGPSHPDVAESLQSLAVLRLSQGRYDEAEDHFRRALDLRSRLLGETHPLVAESQAGLATLLQERSHYDEAEDLHRQALALRRQALGENHPDVAHSLNALGLVLWNKGAQDEAEQLLRQSLALRRRLFGNVHADVATTQNNLALVLQRKQDYDGAEALFREALATWRELLGDDHPDVTTCMNNLALLLNARGDHAGAETIFRQVLALDLKQLGEDHPYVASSKTNLARALQQRQKFAEAEQLFQEALALQRRVLGADHANAASTLRFLANLYRNTGRYAEAESMYVEALATHRKHFGDDDERVRQIRQELAALRGTADTSAVAASPR